MLLTSPQPLSVVLWLPAAWWSLLLLIGFIVPGCGAGVERGFTFPAPFDSTTPVRVISQFYRDNKPEDLEVQIVGPSRKGCADLNIDDALRDRIIKSVQCDTRDLNEEGASPVGIETLLTVSLHGPHYSLRIRLLRDYGFAIGAMIYHVKNPSLAKALTEVCENEILFAGYEGRILRYSLALGAGSPVESPGPATSVEQEQVDSEQHRLDYAYEMSEKEWSFLKKLRALGRDVDALNARDLVSEDGEEQSPLHRAAERGWREAMQYLLLRGADPNARTGWGWTALHIAAMRGHRACIGLLLLRGADVAVTNSGGSTPLHCAASPMVVGISVGVAEADIVEMLVLRGANINARSKDGSTPLHLAAREGPTEVVAQLVRLGADVAVLDKAGKTPFQYARERRVPEVIRLLQRDAETFPGSTRSPK